jgi:hypothetical protein
LRWTPRTSLNRKDTYSSGRHCGSLQ